MYQNRLIQNFNAQTSNLHLNNQLLDNNKQSLIDPNFHQKMMLARMEQMKKVNNVSDLGLSKEQIIDYIICPFRVEKSNKDELEKYVKDEETSLSHKFLEETWWKQRTNLPYKNILKYENLNKPIKSSNDLIVHKITSIDKLGLIEEYDKLVEMLEKHNNELKLIYSTSKETEHVKQFEYINKYKYRMAYNPKDSSDLREYYKNEQKKIEKEQKRIDDIISRLTDENISEEEIKQLESQFVSSNTDDAKKISNIESEIDQQILQLINEHGKSILDGIDNKLNITNIKDTSDNTVTQSVKVKIKREKNMPQQNDAEPISKTVRIHKKS